MSLSGNEVRSVAHLARLSLSDDEVEIFAGQLSSILDYIAKLDELDTDGVEPTSHALDLANALREDEVKERFRKGVWAENAPLAEHGHFRVPKVIE